MYQKYPQAGKVKITDEFWTSYLFNIRHISLPYILRKLSENNYITNFINVTKDEKIAHIGKPFSDGLLFETMRGVCDFLAYEKDALLETYMDTLIEIIAGAQAEDGFICTMTMQRFFDKHWGDNDGDIVFQHDLYNHGCLIEAAISHYKATGKTSLLLVAVRAANLIVNTIGKAPKKNIIPGHSLSEEAFVKLYRLFRDDASLADFANENNVNFNDYLDIAEFWYDARGDHKGRFMCKYLNPDYNQDHVTFAEQREALGHSVRAMLCYLGATVVAQEKGRSDYINALNALWDNVVYKKLHISGGIGARHDIEGFAEDYNLPNKAYLETCAAIGLAFWNTEMNIIEFNSKYFDCFERSLYNNVLSAVGADFTHFFYQNPLESDGTLRRWEWHTTPCCPPMILKLLTSLSSFIYSYDEDSLNVNMLIDSVFNNDAFSVKYEKGKLYVDSKGKKLTLRVRIPEYAENFTLSEEYTVINGYAVMERVWNNSESISVSYNDAVRRVFCNPKASENIGKVAIMKGAYVMCAEGIDNGGSVDITVPENVELKQVGENIEFTDNNGKKATLIPYYKWCNRAENETDAKMTVWLAQENMKDTKYLAEKIGDYLYHEYN